MVDSLRIGGAALLAGVGAELVTAIAMAVVDLYVTGHGGESIMRTWIEVGDAVALSRADVVLLAVVVVAAALGAWLARPRA